ncbi:hypothetical protein [Yinghuangia soli]|uniref:Uncharacterized protein n=1 Tax=Yinghuangia soli TaxID=2908204 RepID=A0AA41U2L7_9ACTN|nr:hypothetical protein [Yinghuangia soli]MCF2530820.1 hypothetical protein [Yinghuangia soli]
MGYDLHITRRANWWDEGGPVITAAEWLAVIAADPGLVALPDPPGAPGPVRPAAELAEPPSGRGSPELCLRNGEVMAKSPSDALLVKMCEIAAVLGARVQGDDGEYFVGGVAL